MRGKTDDTILFYAAETTLQLHMTESSELIRELYASAYSLPLTTKRIQSTIDRKVKRFLETTLLIFEVPKEKIREAVEFVQQFDFKTIAEKR